MEIMKGLLSIIRRAVPATPVAKPAARADFDRRLAAFRKANGIVDRCHIGFVCGRTGLRFESLFERGAPSELFALASTHMCGSGNAAAAVAPCARVFSVAELDLSGWACPGCKSANFVHCQCGINGCDPRPQHNASVGLYRCPGCGLETRTVPLTRIETRQGGSIRAHAKAAQLRGAQPRSLLTRK
jgi:hypothetical protein